MPINPGLPNIVDRLETFYRARDFTRLSAAIKAADLTDTLKGAGPIVLFAPWNKAFDEVPTADWDALMAEKEHSKLTELLLNHVFFAPSSIVSPGGLLTCANGAAAYIERDSRDGNRLLFGTPDLRATIIKDLSCSNGNLVLIDTVITTIWRPR